jgi:hypothetical protein
MNWIAGCRNDYPMFPHYVAYIIRDNKVIIVSVAHARRMPEYWKARLSS